MNTIISISFKYLLLFTIIYFFLIAIIYYHLCKTIPDKCFLCLLLFWIIYYYLHLFLYELQSNYFTIIYGLRKHSRDKRDGRMKIAEHEMSTRQEGWQNENYRKEEAAFMSNTLSYNRIQLINWWEPRWFWEPCIWQWPERVIQLQSIRKWKSLIHRKEMIKFCDMNEERCKLTD